MPYREKPAHVCANWCTPVAEVLPQIALSFHTATGRLLFEVVKCNTRSKLCKTLESHYLQVVTKP